MIMAELYPFEELVPPYVYPRNSLDNYVSQKCYLYGCSGGGVCPAGKMASQTIQALKIACEFALSFDPFPLYGPARIEFNTGIP